MARRESPCKRYTAHPGDAESWKHFDALHPDFASEPRNVRLGLCTDGFAPFGQFGKAYSCWPVMLTPYNLPPWLCMKKQFIFLSLIVPGPKNPKKNLDVFLQPLIRELKELWEVGVFTYDVSKKENFQLRASLMWTINDFPAYGMLSGWGTAGEKACPYCGNGNKSFWLKNGRKWCWFDCHRQFLSPDHSFRKDNKHFSKNTEIELDSPPRRLNGDEIWECVEHLPTIVNGTDSELKMLKSRREGWWKRSIFWELPYWKTLLIRHNLDVMHIEKNFFEQLIHIVMDNKTKTAYNESSKVTENILRCVNESDFTLHGLKSHDCHVFMERLLPVALKNLLPKNEWNAITEISQFFRDLCVSTIKVDDVCNCPEKNIPEILCKLEMIFPPSFFNSMEHLPVHLPYEVKVGGPVQYRWMYPFERFLNHLKRKIGNKAYVEGSICNAYLLEEISNFCSFYFEDHIDTKAKNLDIGNKTHLVVSTLPELFQDHMGRTTGKCRVRSLEDKEYDCAHKYVLSNCEVLQDCVQNFIRTENLQISVVDVWNKYDKEFSRWFRQQVSVLDDDLLRALAMGPSRQVRTWNRYSINGYNFRTFNHKTDVEKSTINNGVCVSSIEGADYYGILDEVIELSYAGANGNIQRYDPFVLAYQVEQVYYAPYPNTKKDRDQWSVVFKTKARSKIEAPIDEVVFQEEIINHVSNCHRNLQENETDYDDYSDVGEISIMNEVVEGNLDVEEGEYSDDHEVLEQQIDDGASEEDEELFPEYDNNDLEHNDEEEDDL
ncbi:uncharacterized protein LOC141613344 [Silene latifolia]|uniref:uncharacterized protein LOC141613344 n=1 Tax=Silene latifolia TaxID=37657 RepID=UPI003D77E6BB